MITGFISNKTTEIDDFGLATTSTNASRSTRAKTKKAKPRKNLQKSRYTFLQQSTRSQAYADYFNPNEEVEGRMLGLPKLVILISLPSLRNSSFSQLPERNIGTDTQGRSLCRGRQFSRQRCKWLANST
jgi:hypothetical protein